MRPGDCPIVTAERIDESGHGVGHVGEHRVHADGLAPGERGRVRIAHVSPHRPEAWGIVEERLDAPAPERVEPPCPAFGACGGCGWQHLCAEAQLGHKRARVEQALAATLHPAPAVAPVIPAPSSVHYRNRGKYVIGDSAGGIVLGAYRPRTHDIIDTRGCLVVDPSVDAQAQRLAGILAGSGLPVYDERSRTGVLRYAVVRSGADGGALVIVVTSGEATRSAIAPLAETLGGDADVTGVIWMRNDARSGTLLSDNVELMYGRGTILERFAGVDVAVGPRAFVQVNRDAAAIMYRDVAAAIGDAGVVLDLYCGVGAISFHAATSGARVVGVDSNAEAVATARAAATDRDNLRFECADAADVDALLAEIEPDVVVVNPPRKGLAAETRRLLLARPAARIVYVSCGPETLARDLAELTRGGYRIGSVQPYDLMPGTAQVETVVVLER